MEKVKVILPANVEVECERDPGLHLVNAATDSFPQEFRILDPTRDSEWDAVARLHSDNSVFHSAAWGRVLTSTYGHKPFYLCFFLEGKLTGAIPLMELKSPLSGRRGISLPFSDFCGPLFFDGFRTHSVMSELSKLARKRHWKYLEVRGRNPLAPLDMAPSFLGHELDLTVGLPQLREQLTSPVRRNLRKAERSGLSVQVSQNLQQVLEFYRLHVRTRRRHGLPPQSKAFFSNIYQYLIGPGLGFVVLVSANSRPIAGAVFLHTGSQAVYKFAASDERFAQYGANNLVMWEGMKFLSEAGFASLHFGRTALDNQGLRRFKLAWGSKEETIVYSRFDPATAEWTSPLPKSDGFHERIFRKLPLTVNRLIGTICYPHLD